MSETRDGKAAKGAGQVGRDSGPRLDELISLFPSAAAASAADDRSLAIRGKAHAYIDLLIHSLILWESGVLEEHHIRPNLTSRVAVTGLVSARG